MSDLSAMRQELTQRKRALERRIGRSEAGIDRARSERGVAREVLVASYPAVEEVANAERHELSLVESALRRIAAREYDCCITCGGEIPLARLQAYPYSANCERCTAGFGVEYDQQLRAQHVELRRLIDALGGAMEALVGARAEPDPVAAVATMVLVEDLSGLLPEHFELEERGGYFAEALTVAPRLRRRAEALRVQHEEFGRRVDDLVERTRKAGDSPRAWQAIAVGFEQLAGSLREHERQEGVLVRDAFGDDLGSGD